MRVFVLVSGKRFGAKQCTSKQTYNAPSFVDVNRLQDLSGIFQVLDEVLFADFIV
jgi:hypothetical protein